jgi:hypothetical protein
MTRFLQWRKMTWAIALWSGGVLGWLLFMVLRPAEGAAGCVTDSAGVTMEAVTRQNCLDAAGGATGLEVVVLAGMWLFGVVVLSAIWFETRPLWRQGYGARIRRLRAVPHGDV